MTIVKIIALPLAHSLMDLDLIKMIAKVKEVLMTVGPPDLLVCLIPSFPSSLLFAY